MTLFSLILALLIEQARPLNVERWMYAPLRSWARLLNGTFNDGEARHGAIAWLVGVLAAVFLAAAAFKALYWINPLLAFAWNVAVLYLTMGFRQSSHWFTDIHLALRMGELDRARQLIGEWRGRSAERTSSSEVARLAIEQALVASHRQVFAVIVWFLVLPGPAGAVLYRLAEFFAREWGSRSEPEFAVFGRFAREAFDVIDWLPARVTAAAFAVVGDFEDALYCWRTQASRWGDAASGILLASGAGAIGVRLGMPVWEGNEITERPEIGLGEDADADFMQSTIGLIWRTLVLCLLLLTLLGIASWVGH